MHKKLFLTVLLSAFFVTAVAKETILVMNYNLLFYGYYTSFCTPDNNNVEDKAEYLHTIINHFRPDIFTVNELGKYEETADHLLENALNVGDIDFYERAGYTNTANSSLVNMLYFNKNKFGMVSQAVPSNVIRDINLYKLYYKSEDLEYTQDTTFVVCVVAHLKAGSSSSDQELRRVMVNNVMAYLDHFNYEGNVMFMGDFNVNSSFEESYQLMIDYPENPDIRFNDPIDKPGQWWNNPDMAMHHTQSTRTGYHPCFVTGGMDDRYDFILVSNDMLTGYSGLKYVEDSYMAVGQDGLRFNQSLVDPPNFSQPPEIISAMYNFSDHLPVILELEVTENLSSDNCNNIETINYLYFNNIAKEYLEIFYNFELLLNSKIRIVDILGNELKTTNLSGSPQIINLCGFAPGLYFLVLEEGKSRKTYKFLKI